MLGQRGEIYDTYDPKKFLSLHKVRFTSLRLHREECSEIGERLSEINLALLIKGVVLAEMSVWAGWERLRKTDEVPRCGDGWPFIGSTTITQFLMPKYGKRFGADRADALVEWCLENTNNDYAPFGSDGFKSYTQWRKWKDEEPAREALYWKNVWEGVEIRRVQRIKRKMKKQSRKSERYAANRHRKTNRDFVIEKLAALSPLDRLKAISQEQIALEAVPNELVAECIDLVDQLGEETRAMLITRIDRRRHGIWGRIWRKLRVN